jgi:riboflavin synthase
MFTGIITDVGTITAIDKADHWRMEIQTKFDTAKIPLGASISCNGVCLTNIETGNDWFAVQVGDETRTITTAVNWQVGTQLNLERALAMGDELGGHLVLGHVDGIARVDAIQKLEDITVYTIKSPADLMPLIAPKGSVCLDGVSLTVNELGGDYFKVGIVPHTFLWTNFSQLMPGSQMNIEVDMIARYLARILSARAA